MQHPPLHAHGEGLPALQLLLDNPFVLVFCVNFMVHSGPFKAHCIRLLAKPWFLQHGVDFPDGTSGHDEGEETGEV